MSVTTEAGGSASAGTAGAAADGPRRRRRQLVRRALLAMIAALYLVSVPWYRDSDAPLRLVMGLPDWVAVALGCYIAVAVLNALAWSMTDIPHLPDHCDSKPEAAIPDGERK